MALFMTVERQLIGPNRTLPDVFVWLISVVRIAEMPNKEYVTHQVLVSERGKKKKRTRSSLYIRFVISLCGHVYGSKKEQTGCRNKEVCSKSQVNCLSFFSTYEKRCLSFFAQLNYVLVWYLWSLHNVTHWTNTDSASWMKKKRQTFGIALPLLLYHPDSALYCDWIALEIQSNRCLPPSMANPDPPKNRGFLTKGIRNPLTKLYLVLNMSCRVCFGNS